MITRTPVRGTAMTGIGCSAPTLAAAVELPLLYDALMLDIAGPTECRPVQRHGCVASCANTSNTP